VGVRSVWKGGEPHEYLVKSEVLRASAKQRTPSMREGRGCLTQGGKHSSSNDRASRRGHHVCLRGHVAPLDEEDNGMLCVISCHVTHARADPLCDISVSTCMVPPLPPPTHRHMAQRLATRGGSGAPQTPRVKETLNVVMALTADPASAEGVRGLWGRACGPHITCTQTRHERQ
jgi:hypothetical protein